MKTAFKLMLALSLSLFAVSAYGEDDLTAAAGGEQQMPPMGKPAEMDKMLKLVGTWTADLQMRIDTSSNYISSPCTLTMEAILDDCAILTHANTTMMGMPFKGAGIATYNRETKEWEQSWVDNISAFQTWSKGEWKENTITYIGKAQSMGMEYMTKDVATVVSDTEMHWSLDMSYDGGQTWGNMIKATYKKKM